MSLSRALTQLPRDDHTERVLRDVLILFNHHEREWMTESDVQLKTGRTSLEVRSVLPALADAFVLERDDSRYRFSGDVVLRYEIDGFMRRAESHQSHMRTNVARFRERQSY